MEVEEGGKSETKPRSHLVKGRKGKLVKKFLRKFLLRESQ